MDSSHEKKRSKFSMSRLLTIKKSIIDSFSSLSKPEKVGSASQRNNTVPREGKHQGDKTSEQSPPNFVSEMKFPDGFRDFGNSKIDFQFPSETSEQKSRQEETYSEIAVHVESHTLSHKATGEERETVPLHNRVPEDCSKNEFPTGAFARSVDMAMSNEYMPCTKNALYATASTDARSQKRELKTLPLPRQEVWSSMRRSNPIYELSGPLCPPRMYDEQREHSDIKLHQADPLSVPWEERQFHSDFLSEKSPTSLPRTSVDRMHLDNRINESLCSKRSKNGNLKSAFSTRQETGIVEISTNPPNSQTLSDTEDELLSVKDQGTQTDFQMYCFIENQASNLNPHRTINTHIMNYIEHLQEEHVKNQGPVYFSLPIFTHSRYYHEYNQHLQEPTVRKQVREKCEAEMMPQKRRANECIKYFNQPRSFWPYSQSGDMCKTRKDNALQPQYSCNAPQNILYLNEQAPILHKGDLATSIQEQQISPRTIAPEMENPVAGSISSPLNLLSPPSADTSRFLSDDGRSVFSSEGADSDFVFYPCVSTVENVNSASPNHAKDISVAASPRRRSSRLSEDYLSSALNGSSKSRSDCWGSSLDDVTRQFFLDEDALSDDVFMEDAEQHKYPYWKYNTEPSPRRLASIEENCQNEYKGHLKMNTNARQKDQVLLFISENRLSNHRTSSRSNTSDGRPAKDSHLSHSSIRSDELYAYKYDDIDEVLENFKDLATSNNSSSEIGENSHAPDTNGEACVVNDKRVAENESPSATDHNGGFISLCENSTDNVKEKGSLETDENQGDSGSPIGQPSIPDGGIESGETVDNRFADMFDSLRRNSVQSRSRQLWRKRRSYRRKSILESRAKLCTSIDKESAKEDKKSAGEVLTSQPSVLQYHNGQNEPPLKPIRGILKSVFSLQPVSAAEKSLCDPKRGSSNDKRLEHYWSKRRSRSLGFEVYPFERTEAMYCKEIRDMQYEVTKECSAPPLNNRPDFYPELSQTDIRWPKGRSKSLTTDAYSLKHNEALLCPEQRNLQLTKDKLIASNLLDEVPTAVTLKAVGSNIKHDSTSENPDLSFYASKCLASEQNGTWAPNKDFLTDEYEPPKNNASPETISGKVKENKANMEKSSNKTDVHVLTKKRSDWGQEAIAVRKDSLDVYRWSTSFQRRRKLQGRRAGKSYRFITALTCKQAAIACPVGRHAATL
ncbi:hypothetical protein PoB_005590700 [Plakobranchus ocellatus]|uniref:Uncharacterized protein n=1 Tax=Plakobranchus ocellatus TaxID=259542 RepID=A0AAV4CDX9_9GAST|nr:hypothetical protein PoB_005590700 [Plakobranchus ocellatus]